MEELILTYRKLVMPEDINHAQTLFGGRLMQWADEAAVLYAMCQLGTKSIVTLKVSEVLFKNPAENGDILEFWTRKKKIGTTSLSVDCIVTRKIVDSPREKPIAPDLKSGKYMGDPKGIILRCEFVFVTVDVNKKPTKHQLAK
jgi:acyl-CoA hydrolase